MQAQQVEQARQAPRIYSGLGTRAGRGRNLAVRASLLDMPGRERMREKAQALGFGIGIMGGAAASHHNAAAFDFGALAASNSLTVRQYLRADLGVSGTTGAGISAWANQTGSASGVTPATGATNGIATVTVGLGGRAGLASSSFATQGGVFTMPAQAAQATTNVHKWWIARVLALGSSSSNFLDTAGGVNLIFFNTSGNFIQYNGGVQNLVVPTATTNLWHRGRASFTGSASDVIRVGSQSTTASVTNQTPTTSRAIFCATTGPVAGQGIVEFLCSMELEGTLANFLTFDAAAATQAQSEWTSAIQI